MLTARVYPACSPRVTFSAREHLASSLRGTFFVPPGNLFCSLRGTFSARVHLACSPRAFFSPRGVLTARVYLACSPRGTFPARVHLASSLRGNFFCSPREPFLLPQRNFFRTGTPCLFPQEIIFCSLRGALTTRALPPFPQGKPFRTVYLAYSPLGELFPHGYTVVPPGELFVPRARCSRAEKVTPGK